MTTNQPPSGGCVLKLHKEAAEMRIKAQPPSGGCVLKPYYLRRQEYYAPPAAFGRLCVET